VLICSDARRKVGYQRGVKSDFRIEKYIRRGAISRWAIRRRLAMQVAPNDSIRSMHGGFFRVETIPRAVPMTYPYAPISSTISYPAKKLHAS
jgi:hypothetical protein